ncbi:MAG: GGDEF domain-containing protein [Bilophila sp.]
MRGCGPDDAYCFLLLDVDRFKTFNDRYGHMTGDAVLRYMGRSMRRSFRSGDILCRWGGDEYVIFLCGVDDEEAVGKRIESLRGRMAQCHVDGLGLSVTLSVGGAFGRGPGSLCRAVPRGRRRPLQGQAAGPDDCLLFDRVPPAGR